MRNGSMMSSIATRGSDSAAGDLVGALGCDRKAERARAAVDDQLELRVGVEVEPHRDAAAVARRRGGEARAGGGADQREARNVDRERARRRPGPDDQIEL